MGWDRVLQWLYPLRCFICRVESAEALCNDCIAALPRISEKGDPLFRSAFFYTGHVRKLVHHVKFQRKRALGLLLGRIMGEHLGAWVESIKPIDVILPVPTTSRTERHRSYNQAEILARGFSEASGIPVMADVLWRKSRHAHQYQLTAREREENIQKAFSVSHGAFVLLPRHPRILLVDDVYTTGATVRGCREVLRHAGFSAHGIFVATLARVYNLR